MSQKILKFTEDVMSLCKDVYNEDLLQQVYSDAQDINVDTQDLMDTKREQNKDYFTTFKRRLDYEA